MEMTEMILDPLVRYGFVGFSAVLLGIVVWLIRRLLVVLEQNSEVSQYRCDQYAVIDDGRLAGAEPQPARQDHQSALHLPGGVR